MLASAPKILISAGLKIAPVARHYRAHSKGATRQRRYIQLLAGVACTAVLAVTFNFYSRPPDHIWFKLFVFANFAQCSAF